MFGDYGCDIFGLHTIDSVNPTKVGEEELKKFEKAIGGLIEHPAHPAFVALYQYLCNSANLGSNIFITLDRHTRELTDEIMKDFTELAENLAKKPTYNIEELNKIEEKYNNHYKVNIKLRIAITAIITAVIFAPLITMMLLIPPTMPIGMALWFSCLATAPFTLTGCYASFFGYKKQQALTEEKAKPDGMNTKAVAIFATLKKS